MKYKLDKILNVQQIKRLMDKYSEISNNAYALLDIDNNIIAMKNWQKVCTDFHRADETARVSCLESDSIVKEHLEKGKSFGYKCKNGLMDYAIPIIAGDEHIATLYFGQVFTEEPDLEFFKDQAIKYNFNEEEYLKAVKEVPIISEEKSIDIISYFLEIANFISSYCEEKINNLELKEKEESIKAELKESKERLQLATDASNDGIYDWDLENSITYANDKYYTMFGYEPGEFEIDFKSFKNMVHPDDIDDACKQIDKHIKGETNSLHIEYRFKTKSEKWVWVVSRGKIVKRDKSGNPLRLVGSLRDIDKRKNTEITLKRYSIIFETISDSIVVTDIHGKIIDWNKASEKILGYTKEEVLGKTPDLFHTEEIKKSGVLRNAINIVLEKGTWQDEIEFIDKNEVHGFFDVVIVPLKDEKDEIIGLIGVNRNITEQKLAQEELLLQRQRLSYILEGTNVGTWEWNVQTGELILNERWANIIGYTLEEISPVSIETWNKYVHPDDFRLSNELLEKHFNNELDYYECEVRMKHKNGDWIWILDRGKLASRTEDYKPLLVSGTHQEITERKRAENALKESEEKFRLIFEGSLDGIVFVNFAGDILDCNKSYYGMLGYTKEEMLKKKFYDVTPKKWHQYEHDIIMPLFESAGYVEPYEKEYRKKDGTVFPVEITGYRLMKDVYYAVARDITERKKAEDALKESEEKFRSLFNTMFNGFAYYKMIYDENGNPIDALYLDVNPSFERLTSLKREDAINKTILDLHPGFEHIWIEKYGEVSQTGIPVTFEYQLRTTGQFFYIYAFSPKKNYFAIIFSDISEQKQAEIALKESLMQERQTREKLEASYEEMEVVQTELSNTNIRLEQALIEAEESNLYKTEFLANMSHEIRTPLTAILGYNQLIMEDDNLTDEQREEFALILKSGNRLTNLLTDILEISQIEANQINVSKRVIDLEKVFHEIKELFVLKIKNIDVKLIFNSRNIKEIYTDETRLIQILVNLIGNAIKFTEKGHIEVNLKEKNNFYEFSIKDTGIGIHKDIHRKIFESFIGGETGFTKHYQGAGLGLTICKRLVELLGGEIWVDSILNKGSTFYFTIPISKEGEESLPEFPKYKEEVSEKYEPKSMNLAIVDDEEVILKFVQTMIKTRTKHNLSIFSSSKDFLSDLDVNNNYDLIFLDIRMPKMNGIECLKEMRKTYKDIPVIALTAFAMKDDEQKFIEAGFSSYISKPIDINNFINTISFYEK